VENDYTAVLLATSVSWIFLPPVIKMKNRRYSNKKLEFGPCSFFSGSTVFCTVITFKKMCDDKMMTNDGHHHYFQESARSLFLAFPGFWYFKKADLRTFSALFGSLS
jgi:hypothetical protein